MGQIQTLTCTCGNPVQKPKRGPTCSFCAVCMRKREHKRQQILYRQRKDLKYRYKLYGDLLDKQLLSEHERFMRRERRAILASRSGVRTAWIELREHGKKKTPVENLLYYRDEDGS